MCVFGCVGVCGGGEREKRRGWWCGRCALRACLSIPVRACTEFGWQNAWELDSRRPRHLRALDDKELIIIEGSPGTRRPAGRSAKNGGKTTEKPIQTPPSRHNRRSSVPGPQKRDIDHLVDERQLRNQSSFLHCHDEHPLLHTNKNVNNLVQELPRTPKETRPPYQSTTGMSSTLTMSWNSQGRPQQRQRGPPLLRNPLWGSWARP